MLRGISASSTSCRFHCPINCTNSGSLVLGAQIVHSNEDDGKLALSFKKKISLSLLSFLLIFEPIYTSHRAHIDPSPIYPSSTLHRALIDPTHVVPFHHHHHHISIIFLHQHHISIVFPPPPPPPHFYCFYSSTPTTFLLFSSTTTTFLFFLPRPAPHFNCFPLPPPLHL